MDRSARRTALLAAVSLLAAGLAPLAGSPIAVAAGGTEVVLTRPATVLRQVDVVAGDDSGALAVVNEVSGRVRTDWVAADGSSRTLWDGGCTPVGTGIPAGGDPGGTAACRTGEVATGYALDVVHLASGTVDHVQVPPNETPNAWDGQGWYLQDASGYLAYRPLGGDPQPLASDLTAGPGAGIAAARTSGVLVVGQRAGETRGFYWVPRGGDPARRLADLPDGAQSMLLQSDGERLAWSWRLHTTVTTYQQELQSTTLADVTGTPVGQAVPVTTRTQDADAAEPLSTLVGDEIDTWQGTDLERVPLDPARPVTYTPLPRHQAGSWSMGRRGGLPLIGMPGATEHLVTVAADGTTVGRGTLARGLAPARRVGVDGGRLVAIFEAGGDEGRDQVRAYDVSSAARAGTAVPPSSILTETTNGAVGFGMLSGGWSLTGARGYGILQDPLGGAGPIDLRSVSPAPALSAGTITDGWGAWLPDGRSQAFTPSGWVDSTDAFGSRVVWSLQDGSVRYRDLATAAGPVTLVPAISGGTGLHVPVAIWGDRVVAALPGGVVRVVDVRTGSVRDLVSDPTAPVGAVATDEDLVAWTTADTVVTMDLSDSAATPQVAVPSGVVWRGSVDIDDGLLAWVGSDSAAHVRPIAGAAVAPSARALRVAGPLGFSPNGDGRQDTWRVALDASRPVSRAVLTIRRGTTVVRTVTAAGADGSVRDLVWDGSAATGAATPDGAYTWTVAATADDGSTVAATAGGLLTGTVTVARSVPPVALSAPTVSAERSTVPGQVKVIWAPTRSTVPGQVLRYDVWSRMAYWNGSRVSYDAWAPRASSLTVRSLTDQLPWNNQSANETLQYLLRVRDQFGNTAWSAVSSSAVAIDDRAGAVTRSSWWTLAPNSQAYAGADRWTARYWASTTAWLSGSEVFVVGRRCPTCGRMSVRVDGGRWVTVDTYSATTRDRQVLYRVRVPGSYHAVLVYNQATPGRPVLRVDAFAGRW